MNVYTDISDYIRRRKYFIRVPNYALSLPFMVEEGDIPPVYNPISPTDTSKTRASISQMIKLRNENVPIVMNDPNDFYDICTHLNDYLSELQNYSDNEVAKDYLDKASPVYEEMMTGLRRAANRVPELKEKLQELTSVSDILNLTKWRQ